jgi:hypothetical protein
MMNERLEDEVQRCSLQGSHHIIPFPLGPKTTTVLTENLAGLCIDSQNARAAKKIVEVCSLPVGLGEKYTPEDI